jgi:two-component system, LytTR family, sensor kinase
LIDLREELQFIQAYNFLLKTRYEDTLTIEIRAPHIQSEFLIPPLTLQLLVENAVKHNVISAQSPLHITILFDPDKGIITVSNQLQRKTNVISTGKGLVQLKKRFALLNLPEPELKQSPAEFLVIVSLVSPAGI